MALCKLCPVRWQSDGMLRPDRQGVLVNLLQGELSMSYKVEPGLLSVSEIAVIRDLFTNY